MLRTLIGQTSQQHIHSRLIEKAKDILVTTTLTTAEIAYQLGFGTRSHLTNFLNKKPSLHRSNFAICSIIEHYVVLRWLKCFFEDSN